MAVLNPISGDFIDFVKQVIASTGLVPSGCVFDEREKDLLWIVSSEVQAIGDIAVMVSLPSIAHDEGSAMATGYKVSLTLSLRCCKALSEVDSHSIAETIFRAFVGARFYHGASAAEAADENANVYADSLRHSSKGSDSLHTMTITYNEQIQPQ